MITGPVPPVGGRGRRACAVGSRAVIGGRGRARDRVNLSLPVCVCTTIGKRLPFIIGRDPVRDLRPIVGQR